jgi:hypothetical protein
MERRRNKALLLSRKTFFNFSLITDFFPAYDDDFANEVLSAELAPASGRNGTQKDDYKIMFRDQGSAGHGDDFRATAIAALNCTQTYNRAWSDIIKGIVMINQNDELKRGETIEMQPESMSNIDSPFGSINDYN